MHEPTPPYAIVLHAGAGESYRDNPEEHALILSYIRSLASEAQQKLHSGARAVDVVAEVTAALEDFPQFNAGKGAALNIAGEHELEAAICNGASGEYRAVLGLKRTQNPIRLAHALLQAPDTAIISGPAADEHAHLLGLPIVENAYFTVPQRLDYWAANKDKSVHEKAEQHGTAGAIALDMLGNLAAANSTGGTMFKRVGRIGDTAINGAGIHADRTLAVVCGSGEAILKTLVARSVSEGVQRGQQIDDAAKLALLDSASQSIASSCGIIAVDCHGTISIQSNARTFAVASASQDSPPLSDIVGSSLLHLKQLSFYEDADVKVGFAKYPTMQGQAILELKNARGFGSLDALAFDRVWQVAMSCASSLRRVWDSTACSCLTSGNVMHFFPHSTTSEIQVTSQSAPEKIARQLLQETAIPDASDNQRVQLEMILFGLTSYRITARARDKVPARTSFPKPAAFHRSWSDLVTCEPGLRAANLTELPSKASLMVELLEQSRPRKDLGK